MKFCFLRFQYFSALLVTLFNMWNYLEKKEKKTNNRIAT